MEMKKMINNIAYVIQEITSIVGQAPVKKMLQKMVYLLEVKGVNLNCNYILHFYGPYCAMLDHETMNLDSEGVICFDYSGHGHKMTITPRFSESIQTDLTEQQIVTMKEVIHRYKDKKPFELELLTTAIYVHKHTHANTSSEVIKNVKMIKGEKYSDDEILWALKEFPYFGIHIQ
jgi:uncharacterized protein YwgA